MAPRKLVIEYLSMLFLIRIRTLSRNAWYLHLHPLFKHTTPLAIILSRHFIIVSFPKMLSQENLASALRWT